MQTKIQFFEPKNQGFQEQKSNLAIAGEECVMALLNPAKNQPQLSFLAASLIYLLFNSLARQHSH